jgi:uncharacterized protein (DUF488 family)
MSNTPEEPYLLAADAPLVRTIGHSTRSLEEFLSLLIANGVTYLVDVRTVPRSRHNPQFNRETLPQVLEANGIGYEHLASLGGLRKSRADSPNTAWRNASFRGYADYMLTPEFETDLRHLIDLATQQQVAIMCAEAVPWRCHRSLIGDALLVHGVRVEDIISEKRAEPHKLTPWARVSGTMLTYPPEAEEAQGHPPTV